MPLSPREWKDFEDSKWWKEIKQSLQVAIENERATLEARTKYVNTANGMVEIPITHDDDVFTKGVIFQMRQFLDLPDVMKEVAQAIVDKKGEQENE